MSPASLFAPPAAGTLAPDEIRLRLQRIFPSLAEFGRREEVQFVAIGQQLGEFLHRSRSITNSSSELIDSLWRQEGEEVLAALGVLMDDLERHIARLFADARLHQEALQEVGLYIQGIEAPLHGLVKVIKILHSLSFSTRVESSRGHSVVVLQALADDLNGLAIKIQRQTDAVRERLKIMFARAQGAREKTQLMAEVSLRQAGNHLQQCRTLLAGIVQRRSATIAEARRLQDYSATIAAALNEIISSVQFHDITRQQVEHVEIALHDFCRRLVEADSAGPLAARTADLCRIQSAQLRHTRHDLVAAVMRMIASLHSIAPAVQNLAQQTRTLATSTEAVGASLFNDVEPVLATVTSIITAADEEDHQTLGAVTAVLDVLNELSQLLREVESIGTEMKMISLNAGITAAHNLERGAGLGVIARSIQTLSSEVLSRTGEFASVYGQMEQLARALDNARGLPASPDAPGMKPLQVAAAASLARLQLMNEEGLKLMTGLDRDALTLATDVVATAGKITIHIEAGKIIDHLVKELESLAASVHDGAAFADETKILDLVSRNYTMQSERRVHAAARKAGAPVAESVAADRSGLGVNVELF